MSFSLYGTLVDEMTGSLVGIDFEMKIYPGKTGKDGVRVILLSQRGRNQIFAEDKLEKSVDTLKLTRSVDQNFRLEGQMKTIRKNSPAFQLENVLLKFIPDEDNPVATADFVDYCKRKVCAGYMNSIIQVTDCRGF